SKPATRSNAVRVGLLSVAIVVLGTYRLFGSWHQESGPIADVRWKCWGQQSNCVYFSIQDKNGSPLEGIMVNCQSYSGWSSGENRTDSRGMAFVALGEQEVIAVSLNYVVVLSRSGPVGEIDASHGLQFRITVRDLEAIQRAKL